METVTAGTMMLMHSFLMIIIPVLRLWQLWYLWNGSHFCSINTLRPSCLHNINILNQGLFWLCNGTKNPLQDKLTDRVNWFYRRGSELLLLWTSVQTFWAATSGSGSQSQSASGLKRKTPWKIKDSRTAPREFTARSPALQPNRRFWVVHSYCGSLGTRSVQYSQHLWIWCTQLERVPGGLVPAVV